MNEAVGETDNADDAEAAEAVEKLRSCSVASFVDIENVRFFFFEVPKFRNFEEKFPGATCRETRSGKKKKKTTPFTSGFFPVFFRLATFVTTFRLETGSGGF